MAIRNIKINYWGFFGFFGFYGFVEPAFFLFFLFSLFFFVPVQKKADLIEKQSQEKAEHLQKIKDLMQNKDSVTNDDVQKLLEVSDSTAQRYLAELVKNGIIKKKGVEGHIFYTK